MRRKQNLMGKRVEAKFDLTEKEKIYKGIREERKK
jgi:hypothetical protein